MAQNYTYTSDRSKMDWAFPFHRTGAFPIDETSIFTTFEDARLYAMGGSDTRTDSGTAYYGQIISVATESGDVKIYKIVPTSTNPTGLSEIGSADSITIVNVVEWTSPAGGVDWYESTDTSHTTPLSSYGVNHAGVYLKTVSPEETTYFAIDIDLSNYYTKAEADEKFVEATEDGSLMTEEEHEKLEGISEGANKVEGHDSNHNGYINIDGTPTQVYAHPTQAATGAAAVKVGNDSEGHVVIGAALEATDIKYGTNSTVGAEIADIESELDDSTDGIKKKIRDLADELDSLEETVEEDERVTAQALVDLESGKADKATTLAGYGITDAYTKTEVDEKVVGLFHFKGVVDYQDQLPTNASEGDVYQVRYRGTSAAAGHEEWDVEFAYVKATPTSAASWEELGGIIDLSAYQVKTVDGTSITNNNGTISINFGTVASGNTTQAVTGAAVNTAIETKFDNTNIVNTIGGKTGDVTFASVTESGQTADVKLSINNSGVISGKVEGLGTMAFEDSSDYIEKPDSAANGQILTYSDGSWVAADAPDTGVQSLGGAKGVITFSDATAVNEGDVVFSVDNSNVMHGSVKNLSGKIDTMIAAAIGTLDSSVSNESTTNENVKVTVAQVDGKLTTISAYLEWDNTDVE